MSDDADDETYERSGETVSKCHASAKDDDHDQITVDHDDMMMTKKTKSKCREQIVKKKGFPSSPQLDVPTYGNKVDGVTREKNNLLHKFRFGLLFGGNDLSQTQ